MSQKRTSLGSLLAVSFFSLAVSYGVIWAEEHHHNRCRQRRFGEFSEWSEPVNLGPVVNSQGKGFRNQHPAISRNGLSLYFISNRPGGFGMNDIWVSQRTSIDAPWGSPQNLGATINTSSNDFAPNLTCDGHWLYFNSNRPGGCGLGDLYVSFREDTGDDFAWEQPVNLGCQINTEFPETAPSYFADQETGITSLYFASDRPTGLGDLDIYVSTLQDDGTFGPGVLVRELSSPFMDVRPAIRSDGLEFFLPSDRPEGRIGTLDIWVSTRESTQDPWTTPVNLGPTVNSPYEQGGPALSHDGTTMYFYSNRPGSFGDDDLYVTTRHRLHHHGEDDDTRE